MKVAMELTVLKSIQKETQQSSRREIWTEWISDRRRSSDVWLIVVRVRSEEI